MLENFVNSLYTCVTKHGVIVLACRRLDSVKDLTSSLPFVTESRVKQATTVKLKNEQTLGENKINGLRQNTRIVILEDCLRQKYNTKEILYLTK